MAEKRACEEEKRLSSIGFLPFLAKWPHLGIAEASGSMGSTYNYHHLGFLFLFFFNLAASGLGCHTRDLPCIMPGLLMWHTNTLVVACMLSSSGEWA